MGFTYLLGYLRIVEDLEALHVLLASEGRAVLWKTEPLTEESVLTSGVSIRVILLYT